MSKETDIKPKKEKVERIYERMSLNDVFEISNRLQKYHIVFRSLWEIGRPIFTNEIPSAAVEFDQKGQTINFLINPDFWKGMDEYTQDFIVCHEMFHHMLKHGERFKDYIGNNNEMMRMNVAADVVINERLVSIWFQRSQLDKSISTEGCWMNTVFKDLKVQPKPNESTEYYYNILKENAKKVDITLIKGFDQHNFSEAESSGLNGAINEALESVGDLIDDSILDAMSQDGMTDSEISKATGLHKGSGTGGWSKVSVEVKTKKKWESVIKKWLATTLKEADKIEERWDRVNRRFSSTLRSSNFKLPTDLELDIMNHEKDKIDLVFFLDVSGSCSGYKTRFVKAALSIDPKRFNVKLFSFDTQVHAAKVESRGNVNIYGGGGTSFSILEQEIQKLIKNKSIKKYPHSVWVITDGYGNQINPEKPERWHWFMTPTFSTNCIPSKCKIHKLANYE
jgi:predicted metal-dependent peptidase